MTDTFFILLFFFASHYYGRRIIAYLRSVLPLERVKVDVLFDETSQMMSVVIYAVVITALLEGALFGIMVLFFGYDPFLFGILYGFGSLIPVVGGSLVWVPLAIYELSLGHTTEAVIIGVYSIAVIAVIADTFVKPIIIDMVNKKMVGTTNSINALLIFFAIFAGLSTVGFWGIILGPAVTALFVALLRVMALMKEEQDTGSGAC